MILDRPFSTLAPLRAAFRFFAPIMLLLAALACIGASMPASAQAKWSDLSAQRQDALQPLAGEWDKLDSVRRKKWLVIADRYPSMAPKEQKRMQARMAEWARLSPEQRREARENYKKAKTVPTEQKKAEWKQYQTLPDAQKQQLAETAEQKKPARQKAQQREQEGKVVKPVPPQKGAVTQPATPPAPATAVPARAN